MGNNFRSTIFFLLNDSIHLNAVNWTKCSFYPKIYRTSRHCNYQKINVQLFWITCIYYIKSKHYISIASMFRVFTCAHSCKNSLSFQLFSNVKNPQCFWMKTNNKDISIFEVNILKLNNKAKEQVLKFRRIWLLMQNVLAHIWNWPVFVIKNGRSSSADRHFDRITTIIILII